MRGRHHIGRFCSGSRHLWCFCSGPAISGGSGAEAATSGGSGADSWIEEASGVQCAAHTHKLATAITESTEVRGTVSVTASAEALGMPAARTDISGGSITLAISTGPSSASAGAWVL